MFCVTDSAREQLLSILASQNQNDWFIRVKILGRGVDAFAYDISSVPPMAQQEGDQVVDAGAGLQVLIDVETLPLVINATLNFDLERQGFRFENPQAVWQTDLGPEVAKLILEKVNPGIASHGGAILPVDVVDNVVYVRMFGGCQGCGLANVTLTEGVAKIIKEELPQVAEVIDVTHHAAGQTPYYVKEEASS